MKKPTRVIEWNDETQDEMLAPGATAESGAEHGESESPTQ
jgi:hypothetical protein